MFITALFFAEKLETNVLLSFVCGFFFFFFLPLGLVSWNVIKTFFNHLKEEKYKLFFSYLCKTYICISNLPWNQELSTSIRQNWGLTSLGLSVMTDCLRLVHFVCVCWCAPFWVYCCWQTSSSLLFYPPASIIPTSRRDCHIMEVI